MGELLIESVLLKIEEELGRQYWNKNQQEMMSPFQNNGAAYANDTFSVCSYYWGDDEELINAPNFVYKNFKCYWYKHVRRGLYWYYNDGKNVIPPSDFLEKMLEDCFDSLEKDFGRGGN